MSRKNLNEIKKLGHTIGLHSHSHPYLLEKLTYNDQLKEYETSLNDLSEVLGVDKTEIKTMSHPSGSYNQNTLKILSNMGIELGFKQIMTIEKEKGMKKINNSSLEIARNDHISIMNIINSNKLKNP